MGTGAKIMLGVVLPLVVIGGGVGAYFLFFKKASKNEFNNLVTSVGGANTDIFDDMSPSDLDRMYEGGTFPNGFNIRGFKHLTSKEIKRFADLINKSEPNWSASEKAEMDGYFIKVYGEIPRG